MPKKNKKGIDRRDFLEITGKAAVGASMLSLPLVTRADIRENQIKTTYGACYHDCPDRCSWQIQTQDNKIVSFEASQNPYTAGKLCDKMIDFPNDVTYHPNRVLSIQYLL